MSDAVRSSSIATSLHLCGITAATSVIRCRSFGADDRLRPEGEQATVTSVLRKQKML